jgi:hypothetical protein
MILHDIIDIINLEYHSMALKKACVIVTLISSVITTICRADAYPYPGQTLQINTYLNSLIGYPSWTLIIRDAESERVLPYLFEFTDTNHFWIAFTTSRSYIVTASTLKWGPYAIIHNFCHLENGLLTNQSMIITLKGELSPNLHSFKCKVQKYSDAPFPIVNNEN